MQTMRVPVGRVPQIKHTCEGRKIPFIKNAFNNFVEKKIETNTKGQKLSLTEYNKLTKSLFFPGRRVRAHLRKVESHS
jgi:hypothetical protein